MKVAHMAIVTPGRCGLYETTRELVAALRYVGIDSRLVDPTFATNALHPAKLNDRPVSEHDRGAPFADMEWAIGADVIVNHSGYDKTPVEKTDQPVILVTHGRPRSSFIGEARGGSAPIYSYHYAKNLDPRIQSVVTFWPEHVDFHQVMFPSKPVHCVAAPVDLGLWSPAGPDGYDFHGNRGRINIVSTDPFRDDIDPFVPLHAACLFARVNPGTKIHIYAKPKEARRGWDALLKRIIDDGNLGEVGGWTKGLQNIYRAATMMVTAQEINTRSVREAMACGCPVVRLGNLDDWQKKMNAGFLSNRNAIRRAAEIAFNPRTTAEQFRAVLETI